MNNSPLSTVALLKWVVAEEMDSLMFVLEMLLRPLYTTNLIDLVLESSTRLHSADNGIAKIEKGYQFQEARQPL